nr:hypothetical protein [Streptomyces sp. adm13(2018)]
MGGLGGGLRSGELDGRVTEVLAEQRIEGGRRHGRVEHGPPAGLLDPVVDAVVVGVELAEGGGVGGGVGTGVGTGAGVGTGMGVGISGGVTVGARAGTDSGADSAADPSALAELDSDDDGPSTGSGAPPAVRGNGTTW